MTTRAALYLRVSLDSTGERLAVDRQREDCLAIVRDRGWTLAGEYVDNSISASDARKQRPGYDALCRAYDGGAFDALVCWDLDRLTRQPRQLEDWIERAEASGLRLVTANGEADLTTDGGRLFARIKASVARAEVERKSARQRRAQRQRAEKGKPAKGIRPTGYTLEGEIIEEEAALVRQVFSRFLAGESLRGIVRALATAGETTRRGGSWTPSTVFGILQNARYAGRSVYKGTDVGAATWPALVTEAEFAAVQARLADPRRKLNRQGTARKHLGSGLYKCGTCGLPVRSSSGLGPGADGIPMNRYTCRDAHFYRSGRPVDDYVVMVVRARLARPDLRDLLVRPADLSKLADLTAQREALQARLARFEDDYDAGLIDGRRLATASEKARAELEAVARQEAKLVSDAPDSILTAADPVAAFDAAPLERRRAVIDSLVTVTLAPTPRGRKTFDPASVLIEARQG